MFDNRSRLPPQQHGIYQFNRQNQNNHMLKSASTPKSLPCIKMICTGICTYRNRCHYIHDLRIMAHGAKGTCRKKNKEEKVEQKDLFFWPPLATEASNYSVATSSQSISTTGQLCGSDAVASLWHHFVEVCVKSSNKTDFQEPGEAVLINPVSGRPRLSVFVDLAASAEKRHQFSEYLNKEKSIGDYMPSSSRRAREVQSEHESSAWDALKGKRGLLKSPKSVATKVFVF